MNDESRFRQLQPSLIDRLADKNPKYKKESREQRVLSLQQLRKSVERDLAWLFNTGHLEMTDDLDAYPEVRRSVLNYGIPDLSGMTVDDINTEDLERRLRQAIIDFEPRILSKTLRVRVLPDATKMNRNALVFQIEGKLWSQPLPVRLFWKTEVDLELGNVAVTEGAE